MILQLQQGLQAEGFEVSISKLCRLFNVPRRTLYYTPVKAQSRLQPQLVEPVKAMIEENPSFGYRTVAYLLNMNKNTVQRIFQLKGWQVKKRPVGFRPRVQALPSVAGRPDERWATDLCRIWTGKGLGNACLGDRLLHAGIAGIASESQWSFFYSGVSLGASFDQPLWLSRSRC